MKEGGAENVGLPVTGRHLEFWTPIPRVSHFNKKIEFQLAKLDRGAFRVKYHG